MPIQTCFESSKELALFQRLNPTTNFTGTYFDHWLDALHPLTQVLSDRLSLARAFTKTHLAPEEWLPTIELLRRALVLNSEQVTYCFSQLPRTQKNRALRECFLFYLNSPLSQDRMSQIWSLIEAFKSPKTEKPILPPTDFILSEPPSYLFQEFVQTASNHSAHITLKPFFELGTPRLKGSTQIVLGSRVSTILSLGNKVAECARNNPDKKIIISFSGSEQSKTLLRNHLTSHGFLTEDFNPVSLPTPFYWSEMLQRIRGSSTFQSKEKLHLNSALLAHPPYEGEAPEDYKTRLREKKILSADLLQTIEILPEVGPPADFSSEGRILITPFCHLPSFENTIEFSFADESLLEPSTNDTLFSESELETLFFAGFHLPRWSETLRARFNILKNKSQYLDDRCFSCLPQEHFEEFALLTPEAAHVSMNRSSHSPQAPLPVNALSATQLETYAECPSKYLFRR
ncbi:MAG: hypothetical protein ACKN9V_09010, partial [Pseudomonadota bacterium]